ncbi:MAG TPA: hypothetical protein VHL78_02040, partial [Actinomycetota bacterium]|nr:hypothetical protein [Actinomycetota bacterium]
MRRSVARLTLAAILAATVQWLPVSTTSAAEPALPSVRLIAADDHVTAKRFGKTVWLDPGVFVAATGGAFDLRVSRPDYTSPLDLRQVDPATGEVVRDLPEDALAGWNGLSKFFRLRVEDASGDGVAARKVRFCPGEGSRQRIDDSGPFDPAYPWFCGAWHPLVQGQTWGIDQGWAVHALGWDEAVAVRIPTGEYTLRFWIRDRYVNMFDVAPEDASVTMGLTVKKGKKGGCCFEGRPSAPEQGQPPDDTPAPAVPEITDPDPATLPNLEALPALFFDFSRRGAREYLAFGATEWNSGPQPLVVEGFRRPGEDVMDAYQYFYEDGEAVGRAPVGTLEYHEGGGHNHWHFEEFTEYTLLDATGAEVVASNKQSWCLVPTDPIDLTVPGADWNPEGLGFSACGSPSSIWVRETLQVGWGDTYFQWVAGQAFNVTG